MGKRSFGSFFVSQWTPLGPPLYAALTGKTVVIIGGNTGIGLEAAKHFARMKPTRLILGCRSKQRGQTAVEEIARTTSQVAEIRIVDLGDFSSIISFAEELKDTPIDILIANAALAHGNHERTKDGWEQMLQVNHLSTSLALLLLVPNLVRAAREKQTTSRVVITSSGVHMSVPVDELASSTDVLKKLSDPEFCTPQNLAARYDETKLYNVLFVRALADHLPLSTPLIPAAANPGYCVSELRRSAAWYIQVQMKIMDVVLGRTAEQGSRNLLWAALGRDGKEGPHLRYMRGAYVSAAGLLEPGDNVMSKAGYELQEKLWHETVDILVEVAPGVRSIISEYFQEPYSDQYCKISTYPAGGLTADIYLRSGSAAAGGLTADNPAG